MPRQKSSPKRREAELAQKKQQKREAKLNKEIVNLQNVDIPLIPKWPFSRLVREIIHSYKNDYLISVTALEALQEACELYLTYLFSDAYLLTAHRRRVTLDRSDIRLTLYIRQGTYK